MLVAVRFALAPQQQRVFGGLLLRRLIFFVHIDFDFLNLEAQDDGPDQAENEARIMVDDIFRTDRFQTNLRVQERQTFVHVLYLMYTHAATVRLAQLLAGNDFQQLQQLYTVRQIDEQVVDLHLGLHQERVHPFCERLLLDVQTLLLQRLDALILELVYAFPLRHVGALLYL